MFKKISLTKWMVIASVLGVIAGLVFGPAMGNIKFLGDIFLRLMQMSVVFLVMGAIIEAVGGLDIKDIGKLGGKTIFLFVASTVFAAFVGLVLAIIIKPGVGVTGVEAAAYTGNLVEGNPLDLLVNFFPKNVVESMATGGILQVIVFSIFFGLAISILRSKNGENIVFNFIKELNVIIIQIIKIVMNYAPIGIFALVGSITGTAGMGMLFALGKFLIALTVGCIAVLLLFVLIASAYGKLNPIKLLKNMENTIIVAITTTSSAVSLPVAMEDSEQKIGISRRVSRLVNPLGMNLNSHGLAVTVAVGCVTVAQFFGIPLDVSDYLMIGVMSAVATFANLAVPGGALVTMAVGFSLVGLPLEGVAIIAGVDWFAGIIRTLLNVADDVLIAVIVAISEDELDRDIFNRDHKKAKLVEQN